jgi:hypothetical protein
MDIDKWLNNINQLNSNYIKSIQSLIKFIKLIEFKYLTLQKIDLPIKIYNMEYTYFVWWNRSQNTKRLYTEEREA